MALLQNASMWDQYLKVVGLFGGGLAGMFLAGVFTRRIHAMGIITGFFTSAVVLLLVQTYTQIHFFLYAAIGMITCFAVGRIVSMIIPEKKADDEFTRSEEHTSELQSLIRNSYALFCLKQKKTQ